MKYTILKPFGQFDVTATAEVNVPETASQFVHECIRKGLLYVMERTPSTAVEQKVFAPMLGWELNESGTSYKRPQGWERGSVPFDNVTADEIAAAYNTSPGKLKVGDTSVEVKFTVVDITESEDGTQARKMATEMEAKLDKGMEMALGITGGDDLNARISKCHKFLAGLRAKPVRKAKK